MKQNEVINVGIKIPERFKKTQIEFIGFEQRIANAIRRGYRRIGNTKPTLSDLVDDYQKVIAFDGMGVKSRRDLNSILIEYTLIGLNCEQTYEWVLDLAAMNTAGGVPQNYE